MFIVVIPRGISSGGHAYFVWYDIDKDLKTHVFALDLNQLYEALVENYSYLIISGYNGYYVRLRRILRIFVGSWRDGTTRARRRSICRGLRL